jgi:cyclic 2,3-diphosphoglycerate synthase
MREHLEQQHGCNVVGITHHLADRSALRTDLAQAQKHDVLAVELKAAAVDVAVRTAQEQGIDVVFVNNELVGKDVEGAFDRILHLSTERSSKA